MPTNCENDDCGVEQLRTTQQVSSALLPALYAASPPHRVNNSGDISWHKDRVFISEVFRFEDLVFELVAEDFYKVFFRDLEIGEFDVEALRFRPVQVLR
jgi:hypothetical protein